MPMSGGVDFDFSALMALRADIAAAPLKVVPNVIKAVEVTARNIKDDWRDYARQSNPAHARKYASAVDYELLDGDGFIGAEIGPNIFRAQGTFGFLEDAPEGVQSPPQRNGARALRDNLADFERGILMATDGVL